MANKGVKGLVKDTETPAVGIKGLTIKAIYFESVFAEEVILASGETDGQGRFELKYSPDDYRTWLSNQNPNIAVQVFTPEGRLLCETEKQVNVTDEILQISDIKIHRNHLDGWLVTMQP
jgi:hypothetical protein